MFGQMRDHPNGNKFFTWNLAVPLAEAQGFVVSTQPFTQFTNTRKEHQ